MRVVMETATKVPYTVSLVSSCKITRIQRDDGREQYECDMCRYTFIAYIPCHIKYIVE